MSKAIQAVRGMNDLLPDATARWQRVESILRSVLKAYGYAEIRFPIVENTELFARSIGDVTDIVEKEMYSFEDRNGDMLTLRPEGTAGCVRAGIENGILHNQTQRLWYQGPMFRHERPQKGRYRQFHQLGVEVFGMASPDVDAEILLLTSRMWRGLGLDGLQLQINSLGTVESRHAYRATLVDYFRGHLGELDEDSQRRLEKNPLRILDTKNPAMKSVVDGAPRLAEHLDPESKHHFAELCRILEAMGVSYVVNPTLVRGLDYYTRTVFEWTTDRLGAQAAVCAGGRYDGLVERLGGQATPAAGFAIGLERLVELVAAPERHDELNVYVVVDETASVETGLKLAERLRDRGLAVQVNGGQGSLKSQMRRADRSGARYCLIVDGQTGERSMVNVKDMRSGTQSTCATDALADFILKNGSADGTHLK